MLAVFSVSKLAEFLRKGNIHRLLIVMDRIGHDLKYFDIQDIWLCFQIYSTTCAISCYIWHFEIAIIISSFVLSKSVIFFFRFQVWNLKTGRLISQYSGHQNTITYCQFLDNENKVVSSSFDGFVTVSYVCYVWKTKIFAKIFCYNIFLGNYYEGLAVRDNLSSPLFL